MPYPAIIDRTLRRPFVRRVLAARQHYYSAGMHRTAGAACYFGVLTLLPFLGLLYLLMAQIAAANPRFLRRSRLNLQDGLGLSASTIARLYSAEGTATLKAVLTVLGVVGLTYAGVAWMDTIRQGLRLVWSDGPDQPWWRLLFRQWLTLLVALPSVLIVVGLAAFVSPTPYLWLASDGLHVAKLLRIVLEVLALLLAVGWASLISYVAYRWLGGAHPRAEVRWAAGASGAGLSLLAAVVIALLPLVVSDPYGIVVLILALMLWVSASVRIVLAAAVWAASAPDQQGLAPAPRSSTATSVSS